MKFKGVPGRQVFRILPFLLLLTGCGGEPAVRYHYSPPERTGDGLETGSLAAVQIDSARIEQAVDSILSGVYKEVHGILIFRDERLVFEAYFKGHEFRYDAPAHHGKPVTWNRTMLHAAMSVTKSVTSACLGIAIDKGFIKSVRQPVIDYLPKNRLLVPDGKDRIRIEHLLSMTSGLEGNEWLLPYSHPENAIFKTYMAKDPITYILNKPLVDEPGQTFQYYGGSNILLGEIINNATGKTIDRFAAEYLFDPLNITGYTWPGYPSGVIDAAGGLKIVPRGLIKIGAVFLNGGTWNGKRIISRDWVEKSGTSFPGNSWLNNWDDYYGMRGYGYSWWTHDFVFSGRHLHMYYAAGWGGQYIMVLPALNMVVVFTGGNYTTYRPAFEILKKHILPAIR